MLWVSDIVTPQIWIEYSKYDVLILASCEGGLTTQVKNPLVHN